MAGRWVRRVVHALDWAVLVAGGVSVFACVLLMDWRTLLTLAAGWGMREAIHDIQARRKSATHVQEGG